MKPEEHDELTQLLRSGLTEDEINSVGDEDTMQMPEMDITPEAVAAEGARPGSIPAQVGRAVAGAKPDLSKPLGYVPPRDAELEGLQAKAKSGRQDARLGQSVADFANRPSNFLDYAQKLGGGGVSGGMKSPNLMAGAGDDSAQAVSDLQASRKSGAAMRSDAEDNDPTSDFANTYRAVLLKFAPELGEQLKSATPAQMRKIAPELEKFATQQALGSKTKAEAAAKAAIETERKAEREAAGKESGRRFAITDQRSREATAATQAGAAATRALAAAGFNLRKDEVAKKADDDINDDVQKLGKELPGDVADFNAKYDRLKKAIELSPDDIAGIGPLAGRAPAALLSREGIDNQKDAGQLLAAYKKLITGTGGGKDELANLERISVELTNEESFKSGLESLKRAYDAKVKDVQARFRPEVVQRLEAGRRREGAGGGTIKMRFPNGQTDDVPASEVDEAKAAGGVPL